MKVVDSFYMFYNKRFQGETGVIPFKDQFRDNPEGRVSFHVESNGQIPEYP